jgi:hypothetical protein
MRRISEFKAWKREHCTSSSAPQSLSASNSPQCPRYYQKSSCETWHSTSTPCASVDRSKHLGVFSLTFSVVDLALHPFPLSFAPGPQSTRNPNPSVPFAAANTAGSVLQTVRHAFSMGPQQPSAPPKSQSEQANVQNQYAHVPVCLSPDCLIPGCGKPVHLNENGLPASDYCSQRHRE